MRDPEKLRLRALEEKRRARLQEIADRFLMAPSGESADREAPSTEAASTADEQEPSENAEDEPVDSTEAVGRALIHDSKNSDALSKILRYETGGCGLDGQPDLSCPPISNGRTVAGILGDVSKQTGGSADRRG